jgi:hypothetical protein
MTTADWRPVVGRQLLMNAVFRVASNWMFPFELARTSVVYVCP